MIQKKKEKENRSYIDEDFVVKREREAGMREERRAVGVHRLGLFSCFLLFFKHIC